MKKFFSLKKYFIHPKNASKTTEISTKETPCSSKIGILHISHKMIQMNNNVKRDFINYIFFIKISGFKFNLENANTFFINLLMMLKTETFLNFFL